MAGSIVAAVIGAPPTSTTRSSKISPLIGYCFGTISLPPTTTGGINKGGGNGVFSSQPPFSSTYQKSSVSVTALIEAVTPPPPRKLSNLRLPPTRTPAQCMPSSLFFVGNPWQIPGTCGGFTPGGKTVPGGSGIR